MAGEKGRVTESRRRTSALNKYFYLTNSEDGPLLYKRLHVNISADEVTAWCYPLHKRVTYPWSQVKKRKEPAFTTKETATMLNRKFLAIERAILRGDIRPPQHTYALDENKRKYRYMWHENDILEAHAFFAQVHQGPPRKDGLITPKPMPTETEIRAMIRQERVFYVKGEDGVFRPTWQAPDF